jgi:hypothetical protein
MPLKFNPFSGSFDFTGASGGGGSSYLDGEVQNFSALPTANPPAVDSAYLVREAEGTWLINRKPAGIYIRVATTGTRATDWSYAGAFPDVFNDANFLLYDNGDSSKNLAFQLSGITTGTTRTLTAPDASGTLPLLETANTFTQNQTLNGTNSTAPNQTAASGSSLMTRDLGDARFAPLAQYAVTTASIGSANNDVLTDRLTLSISATGDYLLNFGFRLSGALPQFRLNFTGTADREACASFTSNGDAGPTYRATILNRTFNSIYNSGGMAKFRVTATGTLSIQHAQLTSSGSACDLQAGAFLHLTKIA